MSSSRSRVESRPRTVADLPPNLARVARVVCLADLDLQFEFGLEVLPDGLELAA